MVKIFDENLTLMLPFINLPVASHLLPNQNLFCMHTYPYFETS